MSDRYFTFENFRYGLDTRKSALTELPGTLLQCVNGFVNAGGDVEQRKSFAQVFNAVYGDRPFAPNCFGLQDTDIGVLVFGSDAAPSSTLPAEVTYQRLQHPTGYASIAPPANASMIAVLSSCNFNGKAFVVAKFNDNTIFCYYNGSLVLPSRNGLVLIKDVNANAETTVELSQDLANLVNAISSWSAVANTVAANQADQVGSALNGSTLIKTPPLIHTTISPQINSANGVIAAKLIDQNYTGGNSTSPSAAFQLNAGTNGSVVVTGPANADGSGTAQISGVVLFTTTLAQLATDIATAINYLTPATGYSAGVNGTTVSIFAPASFGNVTYNIKVVTTGDITTAVGALTNQFSLILSPNGLLVVLTGTKAKVVGGSIQASTHGNTGATHVTYTWAETNADGTTPVTNASGINMASTSGTTVSFSKLMQLNTTVTGYFKCTATDSGTPSGSPATVNFSVTLELDSLN